MTDSLSHFNDDYIVSMEIVAKIEMWNLTKIQRLVYKKKYGTLHFNN